MTRWKSCLVVMFGLVLAATVAATLAASAAERAAAGGPQWPNVALDEPQWPNLRLDDIEPPRLNKRPSFVDPQEVEDRIMGAEAASRHEVERRIKARSSAGARFADQWSRCHRERWRRPMADLVAREAGVAVRFRGRRTLLVFLRPARFRLHQRQSAVRQSDLDARLERADGPQRRGIRPDRPHSVRRVRQGHWSAAASSPTAISTTGISWSRSSSFPTRRATSATAI